MDTATKSSGSASNGGEDQLQRIIAALASPVRREILWLVWDTELAAGDIAAAFDLSAGTISTHLAALREAGLIDRRRDGTFRRYRTDRAAMATILPLLGVSDSKWTTADDLPERELTTTASALWVTVSTEVPLSREDAFACFVSGERYSEWLGVPVTIEEGRFAAELEWGTRVRGHYEVVAPPDLIAMRWDFADDAIPVPGAQLVGYLRFHLAATGCRVELHQRAADAAQAEFLSVAWSMVLGRFTEYAARGRTASGPRPSRPKRHGPSAS
jgi:DNA-binding transcriptional ArsR family regulator/uncharacterized protein YndB with AHSA1/START domain